MAARALGKLFRALAGLMDVMEFERFIGITSFSRPVWRRSYYTYYFMIVKLKSFTGEYDVTSSINLGFSICPKLL